MKFFFTLFICLASCFSFAQTEAIIPPYKKYPTLPPIQLLLTDSSTKFTKENLQEKKPLWLLLFSPECSHCQHTAEELLANKDKLKDFQIVMASMYSVAQIREFAEKYKLSQIPNLTIGHDRYFLLPPFYDVHNLPFMAFYNKKGKLISVFEGSMSLEKVIQLFKEHK